MFSILDLSRERKRYDLSSFKKAQATLIRGDVVLSDSAVKAASKI